MTNMNIDEILEKRPYSLSREEKHKLLNERLHELTRRHYENCESYRRMMDARGLDINNLPDYEGLPFLPVRLFKEFELRSCPREEVVKTMTSSGTTGQQVSHIYLDRVTGSAQQKCLTKIVSHFIGTKRVPMIILDSSIFLFGFTFMVWQHFYKKLLETGYHPDLSKGVLIHGGGWKKLVSEKVSPQEYKQCLNDVCGIRPENVHDYYGMVEQTGCVYMECEYGHLHSSCFSDVLIRNPKDWSLCDVGEKGLIEVVSVLPESYPGHILLTEDEGMILGEDDCRCGLKGKYFKIEGRIKNAEIRGCSDTYAAKF